MFFLQHPRGIVLLHRIRAVRCSWALRSSVFLSPRLARSTELSLPQPRFPLVSPAVSRRSRWTEQAPGTAQSEGDIERISVTAIVPLPRNASSRKRVFNASICATAASSCKLDCRRAPARWHDTNGRGSEPQSPCVRDVRGTPANRWAPVSTTHPAGYHPP